MQTEPEIIFENEHYVVVNKPAGLLSIPDRRGTEISLKSILKKKYGEIYTVHRLDRDTSGLIIFGKNPPAHKMLSQLFENRQVEKIYTGIVSGNLSAKQGTIDAPLLENTRQPGSMIVHTKGKASLTDYEVMEKFGNYSLVRFRIHTGRTHQIRVHMQHLGHPIACDEVYGNAQPIFLSSFKKKFKMSKAASQERPLMKRLALHAGRISFLEVDGKRSEFEAPLPKDMSALLSQLRKWNHKF